MKVRVIDLYTSSIDDNQNIDNELKAAEKWEVKVLMRDGKQVRHVCLGLTLFLIK